MLHTTRKHTTVTQAGQNKRHVYTTIRAKWTNIGKEKNFNRGSSRITGMTKT